MVALFTTLYVAVQTAIDDSRYVPCKTNLTPPGVPTLLPGNAGGLVVGEGSTVRVLLKGRLFAKQGWIFTNDYAETDGGDWGL